MWSSVNAQGWYTSSSNFRQLPVGCGVEIISIYFSLGFVTLCLLPTLFSICLRSISEIWPTTWHFWRSVYLQRSKSNNGKGEKQRDRAKSDGTRTQRSVLRKAGAQQPVEQAGKTIDQRRRTRLPYLKRWKQLQAPCCLYHRTLPYHATNPHLQIHTRRRTPGPQTYCSRVRGGGGRIAVGEVTRWEKRRRNIHTHTQTHIPTQKGS